MRLTLEFLAPTRQWRPRASFSDMGRVGADRLEPWKTAAWLTARNALVRKEWPPTAHVPVTVLVTIPFRDRRRRDAHNYTSTVVKAVVDGLVHARIVPDDTPDWVTVLDPILSVVGPIPAPATVAVAITERTPE